MRRSPLPSFAEAKPVVPWCEVLGVRTHCSCNGGPPGDDAEPTTTASNVAPTWSHRITAIAVDYEGNPGLEQRNVDFECTLNLEPRALDLGPWMGLEWT